MLLYISDAELAHELRVKEKDLPAILTVWGRQGFPGADPQTGKRYFPAVKAWLDRRHGLAANSTAGQRDGEEDWNDRRRTGT